MNGLNQLFKIPSVMAFYPPALKATAASFRQPARPG